MPWHTWIRKPRPEPFFDKHVAVAHAARLDFHAHLPSARLRNNTLDQFPISTGLAYLRCLHFRRHKCSYVLRMSHRHRGRGDRAGRIGKKGAVYATCFRDSRDVWDVSRSWASADRWVAVVLTGSKRGVCHVSVNTPIMTSSHRPALKAARRCIRPLTVVSVQNDPGALKRRLITRRTALSTWPEPMESLRASRVT